MKNLKKYDKKNHLAFSLFEINNILTYIFPIFITLYIKETYTMAGVASAVSGLATIVFILIYGRVIKKRNYFILSTVLFMNDVRMMIMFVLAVICINMIIYTCSVKKSGLA